jgi:hypothetical protein
MYKSIANLEVIDYSDADFADAQTLKDPLQAMSSHS